MLKRNLNPPENGGLRRSMEFVGILYFFFLAAMCVIELFRDASTVSLPIGVPMFFDMAVLSLALIISVFISILAQFRLLAKHLISSSGIDDEVEKTFLLWFGLFSATLALYAKLDESQGGHIINAITMVFLFVSACELILRVKPRINEKKAWKGEERNISQWLRNLRESHGVAVPVFVLLFIAGLFQSPIREGFWDLQSIDLAEFMILMIPTICVVASSTIIIRKYAGIQLRRDVRIGLVIILSLFMGVVVYFKVYHSDASIILFPLLLGYILLGVDRALSWYANYIVLKTIT